MSQPCINPGCTGMTSDHHPHVKRLDWCFSCNHWQEMLSLPAERRATDVAIVDHVHYVIEPEEGNPRWRGFGGQKFEIEFLDGRRLCTSNLWCQGDIPTHWQDKLPDNARFINGAS